MRKLTLALLIVCMLSGGAYGKILILTGKDADSANLASMLLAVSHIEDMHAKDIDYDLVNVSGIPIIEADWNSYTMVMCFGLNSTQITSIKKSGLPLLLPTQDRARGGY